MNDPVGGVFTPNFGRYVLRQSDKLARAPERAPVERENVGLRNELEPSWAWKCGAPEWAWALLSVKMRISGMSLIHFERENANLRNGREFAALPNALRSGLSRLWEAMNGLKLQKFWKWWSPEQQNPPKILIVMLRNGFFGNLWKLYAPEQKFRAENGSLSCGTYPICIHMEVPPPPPPDPSSCSWKEKGGRRGGGGLRNVFLACFW